MTTALVEPILAASEIRLVATVTTAFTADPAARWMYPDPLQFLTHFPDFVRAFAGRAFDYGTADVVSGFACVALWLQPGVGPDETAIGDVLQRSVHESRLPDLLEVFNQMGEFHPDTPHWYLPLIAVDPSEQGRGCGSALLRRALARCDRDHLPAYLEATNRRNLALYERFGFRQLGRIQAGRSPEIIPMLRPAR